LEAKKTAKQSKHNLERLQDDGLVHFKAVAVMTSSAGSVGKPRISRHLFGFLVLRQIINTCLAFHEIYAHTTDFASSEPELGFFFSFLSFFLAESSSIRLTA